MDELQHYGVPGMKWGQRKAQEVVGAVRSAASTVSSTARAVRSAGPSPSLPHISKAVHGLRKDAGFVATREMLRHYGHLTVPAAKAAGKGAVKLAKFTPRIARGSATTLRLLGSGAKLAGKGGKAYVKGAITIARMVR